MSPRPADLVDELERERRRWERPKRLAPNDETWRDRRVPADRRPEPTASELAEQAGMCRVISPETGRVIALIDPVTRRRIDL